MVNGTITTVKLGELRGIAEGLNDILQKELPIKPAYWLGKLGKAIQKELAEYEENRIKLVNKYGLRDAEEKLVVEGGQYQFADKDAFGVAVTELANTEIEVDFNPLTLDQMGDIKISPVTMMRLDRFIVMPE